MILLHDLEGYAMPEARFAHAATKNKAFEAILFMMLRSLQARSRAFFIINLPSRVVTLMSDRELFRQHQFSRWENWMVYLEKTRYVREVVAAATSGSQIQL